MRESYGMSAEELLAEGLAEGDDFDDDGYFGFSYADFDPDYPDLPDGYYRHFGIPKPAPVPPVSVNDGDDDGEIKF
jgi:hypothetical protein